MTLISDETIKKIRESNDIVDVIGSYLTLTQKGKNYFAVCPFHDDHSPSMSVSKEKQIFTCFVCGATGNVITFIRDYLKVSFVEAVEILGKNAGIDLNIKKNDNKDSPHKELYDIYSVATSYYKNNLNTKSGGLARKYLEERNINKDTIDYFDIGLALNGGLSESLSKKHDPKILIDIGLSNSYGKDLFTNRIMFTIKDNLGNAVGFSGRIYDNSNNPKYVNSKESLIFKKGTILYNFYRAKENIRKKKEIIISEGFMEVIRMHTIGYNNVVALMGTGFTKEHLNIIKNMKVNVVLNLDQDEAGKIATLTIGKMLLSVGINPTVIIFEHYKDADEYIQKEGKVAFDSSYKNRVNFIDFKLDYLKKNKDLTNAEVLSKYINDAIESINEIEDEILKEVKIKQLSKEYDISEDLIRNKVIIKTKTGEIEVTKKNITKPKTKYNKYDISEIRLLYLMLTNSNLITYYENHLGYLNDENRRNLANTIIYYKEHNKMFDYADFICYTNERPDLEDIIKEITTYQPIEKKSIDDMAKYTNEEIDGYITLIKQQRVDKQIKNLKEKIKNTLDKEEQKRLSNRILNIKKEVLKW